MDVVLYKDIIVADNFITDEENNVLVSLIDKRICYNTENYWQYLQSDERTFPLKLLKSGDGEYKLYITPVLKDALESLTRGRTSRDTQKKLSALAKMVSERMPQDVRAILKKNSEKMNPGLKMFSINTKIKEVNPNGDIVFYNPGNKATASQAFDPTISEDK